MHNDRSYWQVKCVNVNHFVFLFRSLQLQSNESIECKHSHLEYFVRQALGEGLYLHSSWKRSGKNPFNRPCFLFTSTLTHFKYLYKIHQQERERTKATWGNPFSTKYKFDSIYFSFLLICIKSIEISLLVDMKQISYCSF